MSLIRGNKFILFLDKTGDNGPADTLLCTAQDCQIHLEVEMLEATTPPGGGFRNFLPGLRTYTLEVNGMADELEGAHININDLQQYIIQGKRLAWKAYNNANGYIVYSGFVYLTSVDETSPYDNFNGFTFSAQGDGALSVVQNPASLTSRIYYGVQNNKNNPVDFSNYFDGLAYGPIKIDYGENTGSNFFWMACIAAAYKKNYWQDVYDTGNKGDIDFLGSLYVSSEIKIGAEDYRLYMNEYPTNFTPPRQGVIFS